MVIKELVRKISNPQIGDVIFFYDLLILMAASIIVALLITLIVLLFENKYGLRKGEVLSCIHISGRRGRGTPLYGTQTAFIAMYAMGMSVPDKFIIKVRGTNSKGKEITEDWKVSSELFRGINENDFVRKTFFGDIKKSL